jgi:ATP dependent DNA ligase domain
MLAGITRRWHHYFRWCSMETNRAASIYPTVDEINALPERFRQYIHDHAGVTDRKKNLCVLSERREILESTIKAHAHVGISQVSSQTAKEMLAFVKSHGLEGIIAKRSDSIYEPGRRSGLRVKRRINIIQEFVVGGYVPSHPRVGI